MRSRAPLLHHQYVGQVTPPSAAPILKDVFSN